MEKVTFLESIIKILNLIASVPFFIEILILTGLLLIIMIFFYFRKSKKGKVTALIIYCVTLLLLPISHFSFFVDTLDQIVENYLEIVYFPSCYVYIAMLLITDISVFIDVTKNVKAKKSNWYQALNILYFFVFEFLFFLILRTVISNEIDIFERSSIYSNANLTSLIQISSYLFWIRIGIKFVVFIINRLSKFTFEKKKTNMEEPKNEDLSLSVENINENNILSEDSIASALNTNVDTNDFDTNNSMNKGEINNPSDVIGSLDNMLETPNYLSGNAKGLSEANDDHNKEQRLEGPIYNIPYLNSDIKELNKKESTESVEKNSFDGISYNSDMNSNEIEHIKEEKVGETLNIPRLDNSIETLDINNSTDFVEKNSFDAPSYKLNINSNDVSTLDAYIPTYEKKEELIDSYLNNDIQIKEEKARETLNIPSLDNSIETLDMNESTDFVEKNSSNIEKIPILDIDGLDNNVETIQENRISNVNPQKTHDLTIKEEDDVDNYFDDFYE
ncbi:MAG: hypothetical protein ACI4OG_01685 [Bacilli bacterium]